MRLTPEKQPRGLQSQRIGVPLPNPCLSVSLAVCESQHGSVQLRLQPIRDIGVESAKLIARERERDGPCVTAGDLVRWTGQKTHAVLSLAAAGRSTA